MTGLTLADSPRFACGRATLDEKALADKASASGIEREHLLRQARQCDTGSHLSEWLRSAVLAAAEMSIATSEDSGYLEWMSDEDIVRFRVQAEECQAQADRSIRATDKEAWLRMANEWLKLAQDAERRKR